MLFIVMPIVIPVVLAILIVAPFRAGPGLVLPYSNPNPGSNR